MSETEHSSSKDWKWLGREETELPILPVEKCKYDYGSKGWKFYLIIKADLQDWWEEFNSRLDKKGKVYYKTLDQFVRIKADNKQQRDWLKEMLGPKPELFGKKRLQIPWLGDWYRRRKNGSWSIDNKIQLKGLKKAIENSIDSSEAIKACAPFIIQEMLQYERLREKVNQVFGNEPFFQDESPTSLNNKKRFKCYLGMLGKLTDKKMKLIQEWMRVNGIDPRNPHEMWDMATLAQLSGSIGAAGALTGFTAAQGMPMGMSSNNLPQLPQNPNSPISPTAYMLAEHLTEHARIFKKPLKSLEEHNDKVDISTKTEDKRKTNGKGNGKHVV